MVVTVAFTFNASIIWLTPALLITEPVHEWMRDEWKTHTRYLTHVGGQYKSMSCSLSTLRQYLWHHFRQFHLLYRSKNSHSIYQRHRQSHNLPHKLRKASVVLTFNMSARCLTPASPIALANRSTKRVKCLQNRHKQKTQICKNKTAARHGDSLTSKDKHSQCRVHFQCFGNLRRPVYSNIIGCLISEKKRIELTNWKQGHKKTIQSQ